MKKLLLALALILAPASAWAQCAGIFPANTVCGSIAGGVPGQIPTSSFAVTPGGVSGNVQFNNGSGGFGGYTNTQLTALINAATASLPGALPAWPNNTTTFFRGDGTYATIPYPVTSLCGLTGAPTATQITACLNLFTSSLQGLTPASGGGTTNFLRADGSWAAPPGTVAATPSSLDNLLPNPNWQLIGSMPLITKQNSTGTTNQTAAACSGFSTTNNQPTLTCTTTQQIKVGDLVLPTLTSSGTSNNFWSYASLGVPTCSSVECFQGLITSARVVSVTSNTSIIIQGNLNGVSPASSGALTVVPITVGDVSGTTTTGPDGWVKTLSLSMWPDDFPANAYKGAIRWLGIRKGVNTQEQLQWTGPANQLGRYQGQTITCGVVVNQTIQGGAGTWNISFGDNVNGTTVSSNGTGSGFGGYQFISVTHTIAQSATSYLFDINFNGTTSDVYYVALPTCAFVPSMVQSQLHQNSYELIRADNHFNPPLLTPLLIGFPGTALVSGSGLCGWNNIDLEAISLGQVHKSITNAYAKVEWNTTTVGADIFTGTNLNVTNLTFGLQTATQVSGVHNVAVGKIPLYHDGTFTIFTGASCTGGSGLVPTNGTFDFWDVEVAPSSSLN
jgi:hypothetical protein